MIVWSGRGILIPLVFVVSIMVIATIFGNSDTPLATAWLAGPAFILTGAFSFYFGKKWNEVEGQVFVDKKSGQEIELKQNHSFFWIKMQYWGYILPILGLILIISSFV